MTWKELLEQKRVAREPATRQEIADLRGLAARALADATIDAPLSDDGRFDRAYDAARALATIVLRACGYRVRGGAGSHYSTFAALEAADPAGFAACSAYFNLCREKRNTMSYVRPGVATSSEVQEILRKTKEFSDLVEAWIREQAPEFV